MILREVIDRHHILVLSGPGGVGKTTAAASLGLYGAMCGKKTAVLTIDPAKRLATSLGLQQLDNQARRVDLSRLDDVPPGGELWALMLDAKQTYDTLVRRYAQDEAQYKRILTNKFYKHFSSAIGGSQEFTATERLYQLEQEAPWDLIILDTPPTVHALDFLDAPKRMIDALDQSVFRWVVKPYLTAGKMGMKMLGFGSAYVLRTLKKLVGLEMLEDLSEFLFSFNGMYDGFKERAKKVQTLLHDPQTAYLVVSTLEQNSLQEASFFHRELLRQGYHFQGYVLNRMTQRLESDLDYPAFFKALEETLSDEVLLTGLAPKLWELYREHRLLQDKQDTNLSRLRDDEGSGVPLYLVPHFETDIRDTAGLRRFADALVRANRVEE